MKRLKTSSRGLGWRFRKTSSRALKVTYFEIITSPQIKMLKLKLKIGINYMSMYIELYHMFMAFGPILYELLALRFERDARV
jgi:glycyl-tRNA synthetase alpha subunit